MIGKYTIVALEEAFNYYAEHAEVYGRIRQMRPTQYRLEVRKDATDQWELLVENDLAYLLGYLDARNQLINE